MKPILRAEFRKLFSVRSTYVIIILALVLLGIVSFYGEGFKDAGILPPKPQAAQIFLAGTITQYSGFISVFAAITALLLFAHEYRYNTITYSLSAINRRSKFLAGKILTVLAYTFIFSLVLSAFALAMTIGGAIAAGHPLPHQEINYLTYLVKSIFEAEGYAMAALLFVALIRNQIGALATLFILPGPIEGLLSLLLKNNSVYLPFMALNQVVQAPVVAIASAPAHPDNATGYLSAPRGALVFLTYMVIGWIIAWLLFLRRDATTS